jgi:RNA polymerase sigma factor (sigma-70 family)
LEASAIHAPAAVGRISISARFLRLRSDEQLVELFRAGHDEAFRVIYDRYRQRLFGYVRQMLSGSRQDAEDATQDVFIRAYGALRASGRPVTLRAWLYRVAHNRCIDQLRRPAPALADVFDNSRSPLRDPLVEAERREELRRLVADVRRLPDQQRSALLMRELQGMSYAELAGALDTSIAAVKSLLVRARMGLVEAAESREAACVDIRRDLVLSFDRGVRMSGHARRHVRDCEPCREFRGQLRGVRRSMAALVPVGAGPFGILAKLGIGGTTGLAAGGAASSGGLAVLGAGATVVTATKVAAVLTGATLLSLGPLDPVPVEHHRAREAGDVSAAATAGAEWTRSRERAAASGAGAPPWAAAGAQAAPPRHRGHAVGGFIDPDVYVYEGRYGRAPHRSPKGATPPMTSTAKPPSTSTTAPTTTKDPIPLVDGLLHPGGSGGSGSGGSSGSGKSGSGSGASSGSPSGSTSSNYSGPSSGSGSGSSSSGTSSSSGSGTGSGSGSGSGTGTGSTGSGTGPLPAPIP